MLPTQNKKVETTQDTVSYYVGLFFGGQAVRQTAGEELDVDLVVQGVRQKISEEEVDVSDQEIAMFLQNYFTQKAQAEQAEQATAALEEGKLYLEENKKKHGVFETESGLQFKIIKEGKGKKPTAESQVKCNYEGRLIDGTVFDSSYENGNPATFRLSGVIAGWTEGLQLMKEGAEYEFYIPGNLAYGPNPPGGQIPPNATLIFKVELIEVMD